MSPDEAAEAIRAEARRRYVNDPLHRLQVRMATDLLIEPDKVSEQAKQLVRTGALLASSIALVVNDVEFMRSIQAQIPDTPI